MEINLYRLIFDAVIVMNHTDIGGNAMNFSEFLSRLSEDYPVPDSHIAENTEIFHVQELPVPHPEPKSPVQNVLYFADSDACDEAAFAGLSEHGLNLVWTGGGRLSVCENAFVN